MYNLLDGSVESVIGNEDIIRDGIEDYCFIVVEMACLVDCTGGAFLHGEAGLCEVYGINPGHNDKRRKLMVKASEVRDLLESYGFCELEGSMNDLIGHIEDVIGEKLEDCIEEAKREEVA